MITIKDVAARAGVSVATVSRVLNHDSGVSEASRTRVLNAAEMLGYQPSLLGRHLRQKRTNIILVMLASLSNSFCAKVVRSIEKEARRCGYQILISATGYDAVVEQTDLDLVRKRLADGVIVLNSALSAEEIREFSAQYPLVQCNEYTDTKKTPYISIDNFAAGYEATSYLLHNGRQKIAFLGVCEQNISAQLRYEGYVKALRDHGCEPDDGLLLSSNYGYHHTVEIMREFLAKQPKFDGLFAVSDTMAAAALNTMKQSGLCVPDDVAVIGFDNTDIAYMTEPTLTTVAQPRTELGCEALHMLIERMNGRPVVNRILQHTLVKRTSA